MTPGSRSIARRRCCEHDSANPKDAEPRITPAAPNRSDRSAAADGRRSAYAEPGAQREERRAEQSERRGPGQGNEQEAAGDERREAPGDGDLSRSKGREEGEQ